MATLDKDKTLIEKHYREKMLSHLGELNEAISAYQMLIVDLDGKLKSAQDQLVSLSQTPKKRSLFDFIKLR